MIRARALLALASATLLARPVCAATHEHSLPPRGVVAVPCTSPYLPANDFQREERIYRCGPPARVRHCAPVFVPAWNAVVERCRLYDDWTK